ncbi:D-ribose pyranase [Selenomonas sp. TAMA-11512]|uniref:D-ribose pyranase n=1 Tax=Selenomonas sp. TAMA-11512 TaxID=3095337 RepID=UPI003086CC48|nr:D-ribose pyranase [Selenomonas sp. TAMA-11512]
MKKKGILHSRLSGLIAALGHKDTFLLGDAGMPIPAGVEVVDLAVSAGVPGFLDVLDAILSEAVIESHWLASEIKEANPALHAAILERGLPQPTYVPHEDLKRQSASCRFAVRTGEYSPYPNLILQAGVPF